MNFSTLLFLVLATACSTAYATYYGRRCDDGLIYHQCVPCHLECEDVLSNRTCTKECRPGCACPADKYRNGDECVTKDQCKRCPDYLAFHECRPCHLHCDDIAYNKTCTKECRPGCACAKDTYWNDDTEKCVTKDQCPQDCPNGQYFSYCLPCVTDCKDLGTNKTCTKDCKTGCRCRRNQYWNGKDCVYANWCPNACPTGQFYTRCVGCNNCDDVGKPCPKICKPGCKCRVRGQFWNGTACVYPQQCPIKCPAGQEFSECAGCQNCSNIGKPCSRICKPGCRCPVSSGQFWDGMKCVNQSQCPNFCPSNQVYQDCPSCAFNCSVADQNVACPLICQPGCACSPGSYWNGSLCVAPNQCPKVCSEDQIYSECVGCNYCKDVNKPCLLICNPGCKCRVEGHVWDGTKCVATDQCPPTCLANQVFQTCPPCRFNCNDLDSKVICRACIPGCACTSGTYWNGSYCVAPKQCANYCPEDQIYSECVGCNDCKDLNKPCLLVCIPGCKCRVEGHVWDGTKCVAPDQCPPSCPSNQVYQECPSCAFNCSDAGQIVICPAVCIPGCACSPGSYWDGSLCVAPNQCPKICPSNQVYQECPSCAFNCSDAGQIVACPLICKPGCACSPGSYWDGSSCVPPNQCPITCPPGQMYSECVGCTKCSDIGKPCPRLCKPGCKCPKGRYWNGMKCVRRYQCLIQCKAGLVHHECVPCATDCDDLDSNEPCFAICRPGCACPVGSYWDDGKCLTKQQCKERCYDGLAYHQCLPCHLKCKDVLSNKTCTKECKPGCACANSTYWDYNKYECVTEDQCKTSCPYEQVWWECTPCNKTCHDLNVNKPCTRICKPGCACPAGKFLDGHECITQSECKDDYY